MTDKNFNIITRLLKEVKKYSNEIIESSVIKYVSDRTQIEFSFNEDLVVYRDKADDNLTSIFNKFGFPLNIEFIVEFFEALLESDNINENGIVFTPAYISDYIFDSATKDYDFNSLPKVIDPGCGCGIFLASAAMKIHEKSNLSYQDIFSNCIFGIEKDRDNARRCNIVLNLLPLLCGYSNHGIKTNILCKDSLKCDWKSVFKVDSFDFIVGNPPYVNTHAMNEKTAHFLKKTFVTTKTGVYNIFYAFIEHAMKFLAENGILSYIVPNNFLTIKSAKDLRKFIMEHNSLKMILDFANNMVFKPVRTYNCIIQLNHKQNERFAYCVMENQDDIQNGLINAEFSFMPSEKLDINGWKLVDKLTRQNIQRIESQFYCIKNFIRTGIATLRDEVYIVEKDDKGYYKDIDGKHFYVEANLVKRLYKIPELKPGEDLKNICRYIIFPYQKDKKGFKIIDENILKNEYPLTYNYLLKRKNELDKRDKGKPNPVAWYAFGRTQGLNKYGVKLLFPTFANKPRFTYIDDEYAFFCNGYAVFENDCIDLSLLQRILNSIIMKYYVNNTSYAIEGGYYCYQKKYIENFSLPLFSKEEKEKMLAMTESQLDEYLINCYGLEL